MRRGRTRPETRLSFPRAARSIRPALSRPCGALWRAHLLSRSLGAPEILSGTAAERESFLSGSLLAALPRTRIRSHSGRRITSYERASPAAISTPLFFEQSRSLLRPIELLPRVPPVFDLLETRRDVRAHFAMS